MIYQKIKMQKKITGTLEDNETRAKTKKYLKSKDIL